MQGLATLVHGLSALMHYFTSSMSASAIYSRLVCSHASFYKKSLCASAKIHTMSMLVSLSYAPLVLLATHVLVEFSVDTNPLVQAHA